MLAPLGEFKEGLVRFRDQWMLSHEAGRTVARYYYKHTLFAANPLKRSYAKDPAIPQRMIRTAATEDSTAIAYFHVLDFTLVPMEKADQCDVAWKGDPPADFESFRSRVDELAGKSFRGTSLQYVNSLAWKAVYYGGPLFLLIVAAGGFCLPLSLLFRKLPWFVASMVGAGVALAAVLIFIALGRGGWAERHEVIYQAYQFERPTAGPLLEACEDPDVRIRLWAVAALGKSRDPRALDVLIERLEDDSFFVRYRAAEGLGLLGDPAAEDALVLLADNGTWYEGLYALVALRKILPEKY